MNWLDIIIIVVLIGSAVGGLFSGLIRTVFSLAGLVIGVVLAGRFYTALAGHLGFISSEKVASIVAFIIIFLAVMIIAALLGVLFTRLVSAILLGWINRLAGAVLGAILGALFIAAILAIWAKYSSGIGAIPDSALAPILLQYFPAVLSLLPSEFDSIRAFFR
jgi:membrane protein required for colicin V production